jgi:hypothetical protein
MREIKLEHTEVVFRLLFVGTLILLLGNQLNAQIPYSRGELLYKNSLSSDELMKNWIMEGPGELKFGNQWMHMFSPDKEFHHVLWCPENFPESYIAEWEMQNVNPSEGLCIVFFSAKGIRGEDLFDPSLPERNGDFKYYTRDEINNYHISYYTNTPFRPDRGTSHLRKNNMFEIVQSGPEGIPANSEAVHHIRLIKYKNHILFFIDDRKIIDWKDDGKTLGPVYKGGKIGFRQMKWSHFRYRNFTVWECNHPDNDL